MAHLTPGPQMRPAGSILSPASRPGEVVITPSGTLHQAQVSRHQTENILLVDIKRANKLAGQHFFTEK